MGIVTMDEAQALFQETASRFDEMRRAHNPPIQSRMMCLANSRIDGFCTGASWAPHQCFGCTRGGFWKGLGDFCLR